MEPIDKILPQTVGRQMARANTVDCHGVWSKRWLLSENGWNHFWLWENQHCRDKAQIPLGIIGSFLTLESHRQLLRRVSYEQWLTLLSLAEGAQEDWGLGNITQKLSY